MKKINKLSDNKGVTGADLSIAVVAIIIFVSIITSLFYNVYIMNQKTTRMSEATDIITTIFEKIDVMDYENVSLENNEKELSVYLNDYIDNENQSQSENVYKGKKGGYNVTLNIEKYNEQDGNQDKEDIIKKITINVEYNVGNKTQSIEMSTLKVKWRSLYEIRKRCNINFFNYIYTCNVNCYRNTCKSIRYIL